MKLGQELEPEEPLAHSKWWSPVRGNRAERSAQRTPEPDMPVARVRTLREHFEATLYPFRLFALLMSGCGALALLLAVIGIYGLVSWSVAPRRREVGIRMAFRAAQSDILGIVVRQAMVLVGWGLAFGLLLGVALARVVSNLPVDVEQLFGVSAFDPLTFTGVTTPLALVGLTACCLPARRAARLDAMVTLRTN